MWYSLIVMDRGKEAWKGTVVEAVCQERGTYSSRPGSAGSRQPSAQLSVSPGNCLSGRVPWPRATRWPTSDGSPM